MQTDRKGWSTTCPWFSPLPSRPKGPPRAEMHGRKEHPELPMGKRASRAEQGFRVCEQRIVFRSLSIRLPLCPSVGRSVSSSTRSARVCGPSSNRVLLPGGREPRSPRLRGPSPLPEHSAGQGPTGRVGRPARGWRSGTCEAGSRASVQDIVSHIHAELNLPPKKKNGVWFGGPFSAPTLLIFLLKVKFWGPILGPPGPCFYLFSVHVLFTGGAQACCSCSFLLVVCLGAALLLVV